jgi:hypothetical protein
MTAMQTKRYTFRLTDEDKKHIEIIRSTQSDVKTDTDAIRKALRLLSEKIQRVQGTS